MIRVAWWDVDKRIEGWWLENIKNISRRDHRVQGDFLFMLLASHQYALSKHSSAPWITLSGVSRVFRLKAEDCLGKWEYCIFWINIYCKKCTVDHGFSFIHLGAGGINGYWLWDTDRTSEDLRLKIGKHEEYFTQRHRERRVFLFILLASHQYDLSKHSSAPCIT